MSIFCCSVSVENISLHFQTFILSLIVIMQWDFCAPHRDLIWSSSVCLEWHEETEQTETKSRRTVSSRNLHAKLQYCSKLSTCVKILSLSLFLYILYIYIYIYISSNFEFISYFCLYLAFLSLYLRIFCLYLTIMSLYLIFFCLYLAIMSSYHNFLFISRIYTFLSNIFCLYLAIMSLYLVCFCLFLAIMSLYQKVLFISHNSDFFFSLFFMAEPKKLDCEV